MKPPRLFSTAFLLVFPLVTVEVHAEDFPIALKEKLFARYDQKNLTVLREKFLVTMLNGPGGDLLSYSINYDHFDPAFTQKDWPKQYRKRNLLDEQTTEEVESGASFTDPMSIGEMLRVRKFYIKSNKTTTIMDFFLVALEGKRVARERAIYENGEVGTPGKRDFGFHFRYLLPSFEAVKDSGYSEDKYYDEAVKELSRYFIPTDEYLSTKRASSETAEAQKNIELQPGMSKEDVVKLMGEPLKSVTFGKKTTLTYKDLSIILEDGKVVDVKPN
jgi:hypothetical protein